MPVNQTDSWAKTAPIPLQAEADSARPAARNMGELRVLLDAARHAPIRSLGESLLDLKLIDMDTLARYCEHPPQVERSVEHLLTESGLVKELEIEHARAHMLNTPEVDAEKFAVEREALDHLAWNVAFTHHVVPLAWSRACCTWRPRRP